MAVPVREPGRLRPIRPSLRPSFSDAALKNAQGILGAAEKALSLDDYRLLQAVCKVTKASRGRRHEYAHHLWGIPNIPDALALLDPRDSLKQMVSFEEQVDEYRERMSQWTRRTSGMNLHQRGHIYPMHAPVATFGGARLFERQVFHEGGAGG
jgi:hypothetical protein